MLGCAELRLFLFTGQGFCQWRRMGIRELMESLQLCLIRYLLYQSDQM
jgi:hypothetical protein